MGRTLPSLSDGRAEPAIRLGGIAENLVGVFPCFTHVRIPVISHERRNTGLAQLTINLLSDPPVEIDFWNSLSRCLIRYRSDCGRIPDLRMKRFRARSGLGTNDVIAPVTERCHSPDTHGRSHG